jgi:hypothetical protein
MGNSFGYIRTLTPPVGAELVDSILVILPYARLDGVLMIKGGFRILCASKRKIVTRFRDFKCYILWAEEREPVWDLSSFQSCAR